MNVACPTCGAAVEFRYDDSFVRICGSCRAAVVRSDRGIETLGRVADLVPTGSPLRLFAEGRFGSTTFLLVGMAQLRHGAGGVWQEWYAKLDGGQWAWLSEAQGRFYLTFARAGIGVPPFESLVPGAQVAIGDRTFTVGELGTASYVSALGEIPYRLDPSGTFRFADLSDGSGGFATIDYGAPGEDDDPSVYVGQQVTLGELALQGGEEQRSSATAHQGLALACPNCGGSLELRVPDQTQRVACPYCAHMLSVDHGHLAVLSKLAHKPTPRIPLGTKVTFFEGELTIIGFMQRSALVDGAWYPFFEYLLYSPSIGFRWLVQSDFHWSYVQPVATGAVSERAGIEYDGVTFEHYAAAMLRVDEVVGEFYWKVRVDERAYSDDYIAPPAMLSRERTDAEVTWSLSTYVSLKELEKALGGTLTFSSFDKPTGVAPNQPYALHGIGTVALLAFGAFLLVAFVRATTADNTLRHRQTFSVPNVEVASTSAGSARKRAEPVGSLPTTTWRPVESLSNIVFTDPFELAGGQNIAIELSAPLSNNWAYVAVDLVNEQTGAIVGFDKNLEFYAGVDDGESWSEGSNTATQHLAPMPGGRYVVRLEAQHGTVFDLSLTVDVRQDVFRTSLFLWAFGALSLPFLIVLFHALRFKKKRWENSTVRPSGGDE